MYHTSLAFDSVCIIESLPSGDLRSGTELFETTLAPASVIDEGFVSELYEPVTRVEFLETLSHIAEIARHYGRSPIIHIEAHGGVNGILLASGERVPWEEIAPRLADINRISRMNLLVIAAMCHGWYMSDILRPTDRAPAFGIIGTESTVPAGVLLRSMQSLYSGLLRPGHDLRAALDSANGTQEIENWRFKLVNAELLLCRVFSLYIESLSTEESLTARVNRLVAAIAVARGLDVLQTMELRSLITRDINDHPRWFADFRERFLMLDLFPENARRFPLNYEDCGRDLVID